MDTLPIELRLEICRYVRESSFEDTSALSLTTRTWYATSIPFLYSTLRIAFHNEVYDSGLNAAITRAISRPRGQLFLQHARKLEIVCSSRPQFIIVEEANIWRKKNWTGQISQHVLPATREGFLKEDLTDLRSALPLVFEEPALSQVPIPNWFALVTVISRMRKLEELSFMATAEFPDSVLKALKQHHPGCRVKIWSPQAIEHSYPPCETGGAGLALFDPECVDTLNLDYPLDDDLFDRWSMAREMQPFLAGASNLKHLILTASINTTYRSDHWNQTHTQTQMPDRMDEQQDSPPCQIESLTFRGRNGWHAFFDGIASTPLDLSNLRSLDIYIYGDLVAFQAVASSLVSLERLFLKSIPAADRNGPDYDGVVNTLLAFNPLKYLSLEGLQSLTSIHQVLAHHGPTLLGLILKKCDLRRLFYQKFTPAELKKIGRACPNLTELHTPIQRHFGHPQECNIYKALGKYFPNLEILDIELVCDPFDSMLKIFDGGICTTWNQKAYANAACDQYLVREIWDQIASPGLQRLRIVPTVLSPTFPRGHRPQYWHILRMLCRPFLLTRGQYGGEPAIREIGKVALDVWRDDQAHWNWKQRVAADLREEFLKVWPECRNNVNGDWTVGWESFPLRPGLVDALGGWFKKRFRKHKK
ncbi:hypothetical protein BJX70DRAFT_403708 [Aspergillus crustosus]